LALRRLLRSAERFSESAILRGLRDVKTFDSRSRALLCFVTFADQRCFFRDLFRVPIDNLFALSYSGACILCRFQAKLFVCSGEAETIGVGLQCGNDIRDDVVQRHGELFRAMHDLFPIDGAGERLVLHFLFD
jgi:hypothetical protein